MAASRRSVEDSGLFVDEDDAFVYIFDRRKGNSPELTIQTGGLFSFIDFRTRVCETLSIRKSEKFVIATTNREEIKDDASWDNIDKGDTLYILQDVNQELSAPAQERVNYLPHYDTIVKGGMYEYYASEGQNPLPYAFAELIDNALAATASNEGQRNIEIRIHLDDANPSKNCIFVIDNGTGMTPRQLNNWAIYRLSKFIRKDRRGKVAKNGVEEDEDDIPEQLDVPRSLNSDISYFGVGGKQAIFFIGNSTRMITRPENSKDIHELMISKEEFEKKEKNHEAIYSGYIRNRQPGDTSHLGDDDDVLAQVIKEEIDRTSFTVVMVNGISPAHVPYLRHSLTEWTRQLAHIYHYYVHGPLGNQENNGPGNRAPSPFKHIDIQVTLFRTQASPKIVNLRDIMDDMQSQFVQTSASSFEFKAHVEGTGIVEGVLRYHPFLYDSETFPPDTNDPRMEPEPENDHDYALNETPARGRRPIFECYWNGRLIPYTLIENFEWCTTPKKSKIVPSECYNRVSGVLWTNDKFQVSTNKLTFIDLEMKLRDKNTAFRGIVSGHERRIAMEKEFLSWLKECHQKHDKQIHFCTCKGQHVRTDLPKMKQTPWTVFEQVEWDGKVYKKGQLVKIQRTSPMLLGTISKILLFGEHKEDVFATGGDIEIVQEPKSLYDEVKIVALSRLDRTASTVTIKKLIDDEEAKLPNKLIVSWPNGDSVNPGDRRPAGMTIGDIKIEIANRKGEFISKLPGTATMSKKLLIELKIVWHSSNGDKEIVSHISQHGKNWPYWFRKMENIKNLGSHTLQMQTVLNESGATVYAGKELPAQKVKFTVTEAEPKKFSVGLLDGPFRIGAPFQIPLEFQDEFNHLTKPSPQLKPVLEADGLEISYESTQVRGNVLIIKGIIMKGSVPNNTGKNYNLVAKVPGLEKDSQTLKIRLLPGPPHSLEVHPDGEEEISIMNGTSVIFNVAVMDVAGNTTTDSKLNVVCKFTGAPGLPTYQLDCSTSGVGMLTGDQLVIKKIKDQQTVTARIDLLGYKNISSVDRTVHVTPSCRATSLDVTYMPDEKTVTRIKKDQEIVGVAGEYIKGLGFSLIDEAGRAISVDDKLAAQIKVNWIPKISKDVLLANNLPDVKVPSTVSDTKYCHVSLIDGSGVDFNFIVRPRPSEPVILKSKCSGTNLNRLGETLPSDILVYVKDKHGNDISGFQKSFIQDLKVSAEGLDVKKLKKVASNTNTFVVQGIKFDGGTLGMRKVLIEWRNLQDYVYIEIVAGPPTKLTLPGWNLEQPITVYNDNKLPHPLVVQLCDDQDNLCKDKDIKIQIAKDTKVKLNPATQPQKTNSEGQADFGTLSVSGPRGQYDIQPKAFLSGGQISGPKVKICIQPDPGKPVSLSVDYKATAMFNAGGKLPEFNVKVLAEDDNPLKTAKASNITMKLWKVEGSGTTMPQSRAVSYSTDIYKKQDGLFIFRNRKVPETAGLHSIMFVYFDGKYDLFSNVIPVDVKPGPPTQLVPREPPGTPTVSNTKNAATRNLIRNLRLELRDDHNNMVSTGYNGNVNIEVDSAEGLSEIPLFVGSRSKLTIPMQNGQAILQNLVIQEQTAGVDGAEYILHCSVECHMLPKSSGPLTYDIPFLFYNDAKKQSQMSALSKERDQIQTAIRTYKSLFETTEQLVSELKISVHEEQQEEQRLRSDLRKQNIPVSQLQSLASTDALIQTRIAERDQLLGVPRRLCGLAVATRDPEVLGKIALLGQVVNTDIARVISWHMSADMDCVVTLTTRKAKELYSQTGGKQQVLPLDSIFKKNLPDWSKPLPHVKFRPNWRPSGHPIYTRDLLVFPQDEEKCRTVFGLLLGDTLILDTLDHANAYRQEIVKYTYCPTILTREGDRIRSNGKFGGLMNKALPLEKLRGAVFGEPLPMAYHAICTQIDSLQSYRTTVIKREKVQEELQEQVDSSNDPEMQAKYKECKEAESQLRAIEDRLGMCSPRRTPATTPMGSPRSKPARPTSGADLYASAAKRARTSSETSVNGGSTSPNSNSSITPTRQSRRIASMTPVTVDDGRKKPRKT